MRHLLLSVIVTTIISISDFCEAKIKFFINDEEGWTKAVGGEANIEFFETTASNILLANEVTQLPSSLSIIYSNR